MKTKKTHAINLLHKTIRQDRHSFIIAEAGVNHVINSSDLRKIKAKDTLEVALRMIDLAKDAGADAVKFQSFTAKSLQYQGAKKPAYQVVNVGSDQAVSYYNLINNLETSYEDQIKIAKYCQKKGIIFFSTPYDNDSADFLDKILNVPLFKLASIELNNHLFIRYVARKNKPMILSTGLSTMEDVRHVVQIARREKFAHRLILLQCTSAYPTQAKDINLNVLKTYRSEFPDIIYGLSDHSQTDTASIGAVALGAHVLEKHFTLDKTFTGPDHSSSLSPPEFKEWVTHIREIEMELGTTKKLITKSEKSNLAMRKYLVISPQKEGTIIREDMLKTMRTGRGILPIDKNLNRIMGKELKHNVDQLTPFRWELI